jgi:hypothetical protein
MNRGDRRVPTTEAIFEGNSCGKMYLICLAGSTEEWLLGDGVEELLLDVVVE